MTKESYYEMCELLGTEPVDSEIPLDFEDLADEVQEAILVYNMLQDNFDTMNGVYLGKVFTNIRDLFYIAGVEDEKTCFTLLNIIDSVRSKLINDKKPPK